jgi:hypothetical protein
MKIIVTGNREPDILTEVLRKMNCSVEFISNEYTISSSPSICEGSFALAYPLSRRGFDGIGDRRDRNCPFVLDTVPLFSANET